MFARKAILIFLIMVLAIGSIAADELETANFTLGLIKGSAFSPVYVFRYKLEGDTFYSDLGADRAINVKTVTMTQAKQNVALGGKVDFEIIDYTYAPNAQTVEIKIEPTKAQVPEKGTFSSGILKGAKTVIKEVLNGVGVTCTSGTGTNFYNPEVNNNGYITITYSPTLQQTVIDRRSDPKKVADFSIEWQTHNNKDTSYTQGTYRSTVYVTYKIN